ncbi:MAG: YkgJ family cysteine cluster protein [Gammaproteobacteria bacterium]|nr:YkgJ family cysteine cluster protein [Gammaproteobacteria bacterium]
MNKPDFPKIEVNAEFDSTEKCDLCTNSTCCTYVTQQIDTPKSKYDFEILLWQVSHKGVGAYKDEDGWFVMYDAPCTHLEMDGRCGIYDDRPTICRTHKNDFCEYDAPAEDGFELYFPDYSSLLAYCEKRFKRWTTGNPAPE